MVVEKQPCTMLNIQYRMKPEISSFPSLTFYDGDISNGQNVMQTAYQTLTYANFVTNRAYSFINVDSMENRHNMSFQNVGEAETILYLLLDLRRKSLGLGGKDPWYSIRRIRVITFYQAQVELISSLLRAN